MPKHQSFLLKVLSCEPLTSSNQSLLPISKSLIGELQSLSPDCLAQLFVDVGYLQTMTQFVFEQHWLRFKKKSSLGIVTTEFIEPFLKLELSPRKYLHSSFQSWPAESLKPIGTLAKHLELQVINAIQRQSFQRQKTFLTRVLNLISDLFDLESQWHQQKRQNGEHLGLTLYRTFNGLDEVFDFDYQLEENLRTDLSNKERLFEGAGAGVQSEYSTVLTALKWLNPALEARFIDLGSGYGRLGLIIGLLRPDIDFIGYEYVQHRVDAANTTVANLALQKNVQFIKQDLSEPEFIIPKGDIYYLYDPFCEETYKRVLAQLISISANQKIAIVTKGNARKWLDDFPNTRAWAPPVEFDDGNLCIFSSP